MSMRTVLLSLVFLAGCATAAPEPAPEVGDAARYESAPGVAETAAGPSDWALAIVGTPFVLAFRTAVCAATAVVAGPTAGFLALSDDPSGGLAYVRDGLAQNCGPPYGVPVPVAPRSTAAPGYSPEPGVRYYPERDVGRPRPLIPHRSTAVVSP